MNIAIFKAYDIRGKYPEEINEATVARIAESLERFFKKGKIIVGHDARLSSPSLYEAIIKSINPKRELVKAGLITTPMLSFLTGSIGAELGIIITASHNPKEYNGLKVVRKGAVPIGGREVLEIATKNN